MVYASLTTGPQQNEQIYLQNHANRVLFTFANLGLQKGVGGVGKNSFAPQFSVTDRNQSSRANWIVTDRNQSSRANWIVTDRNQSSRANWIVTDRNQSSRANWIVPLFSSKAKKTQIAVEKQTWSITLCVLPGYPLAYLAHQTALLKLQVHVTLQLVCG